MIETDVLVIGAGPAGLASALALKRTEKGKDLRVAVLDKGRSVGSHVLSGGIVDPSGFKGLLTEEEIAKLPCEAKVTRESFRCLFTSGCSLKIPFVPPLMHSKGYPIISLTKVTLYLAELARRAGVEIYTGYAVTSLIKENNRIVGARTGEKGVDHLGQHKSNYLPSEEICATKQVILAEGASGILTEKLIADYNLQGVRPQTYALGIKELIDVPAGEQCAGETMHTFGWPSDINTYGGGFVYHLSETQVMVGYAYALDGARAEIDPFQLFRRFKACTAVARHIAHGKTVAYGAKIIPEGGFFAVPKPYAPGVLIVGDGAGLVDSLRIKGIHIAFQSGLAAAQALLSDAPDVGARYKELLHATSGWKEMRRVRNVRASFSWGMPFGVMAAACAWMSNGAFPPGRVPGCDEPDAHGIKPLDRAHLAREKACEIPSSPTQVDRLTDVFMSGTLHEEDQPCHLKILDPAQCTRCEELYGSPCTRFCPAEVYRREEGSSTQGAPQVDFSNCLHCKTCRIKCPFENIDWTFPQGGDGPRYTRL